MVAEGVSHANKWRKGKKALRREYSRTARRLLWWELVKKEGVGRRKV